MTMHATRLGAYITIHANSGGEGIKIEQEINRPSALFITVHATEHVDHVRSVWSALGQLIEEYDKEQHS